MSKLFKQEIGDMSIETNIPGTVHLIDIEGFLDAKKDKNSGNIILQPQPSSNPNDPLRWSKSKKTMQFWLLWVWSFILAVNFWGPLFSLWIIEFDCILAELNIFAAIVFLFVGVGCVCMQPTAMKLGRRFVYLLCSIIMLVANILGSQAKSTKVLYVTNVLAGFAGAPIDSLIEISTTDVFFQHERAEYLSWFILVIYAGSDLGPVACGYIVQTMNWRWCYYFLAIFIGALFIIQIFFMEDTTFQRRDNDLETKILSQIIFRETMISQEKAIEINISTNNRRSDNPLVYETGSDSIDYSIPKRNYKQRMKLFELEYNNPNPWFTIFYRPFF